LDDAIAWALAADNEECDAQREAAHESNQNPRNWAELLNIHRQRTASYYRYQVGIHRTVARRNVVFFANVRVLSDLRDEALKSLLGLFEAAFIEDGYKSALFYDSVHSLLSCKFQDASEAVLDLFLDNIAKMVAEPSLREMLFELMLEGCEAAALHYLKSQDKLQKVEAQLAREIEQKRSLLALIKLNIPLWMSYESHRRSQRRELSVPKTTYLKRLSKPTLLRPLSEQQQPRQ
jgi:hypothetical protein